MNPKVMPGVKCTLVALAIGLGGCSKGNWVDAPQLCPFVLQIAKETAEGKAAPNSKEATDGIVRMTAQDACGKAGKSYTGQYDCEDGHSRVKCE